MVMVVLLLLVLLARVLKLLALLLPLVLLLLCCSHHCCDVSLCFLLLFGNVHERSTLEVVMHISWWQNNNV